MEIASEGVWCGVLHTCDMFPTPGPLTRPARPQTPFIPHDENIYISSLSAFQADARALLTAGARLGIDPEHLRLLTGGLHPLRNISPPPLHFTPHPRRPPLCSGSGSLAGFEVTQCLSFCVWLISASWLSVCPCVCLSDGVWPPHTPPFSR